MPRGLKDVRPVGRWAGVATWLLLMVAATSARPPLAADAVAERLGEPGAVLLIRHALAPGIGDPDGFRLDDCATQRNLNDEGRQQARAIGDWLRGRGIAQARVYSSQWCRCLETAALLDLGSVTELPALNSFFERRQDREPTVAALREFIASQPRDGVLLVLVTHQVTISAVSGTAADSGTGVLMARGERGRLEPIGTLAFGVADE
jgi:broad specificity phosphatase PhoE